MATRRERVILELQDDFTTGTARAAAAAALLNRELESLSREAVQSSKATRSVERDIDGLATTANRAESDIDRLSGRLEILAQAAASLGPAFVPIGAVAVPAISGLASQLGFATIAAGVTVAAFQGVGTALDAVNKAQLEPTTANLEAARVALEDLSPAAASFVGELNSMIPALKELRDAGAEGLFPGLTRGLNELEGAFPRVQRIISAISTELGDIAGDAGASLASDRWAPFLDFVADEAPAAMSDLAQAVGNTTRGFAGLWMATTPLNRDFSEWLVESTADFDRWANSLSQTEGFQEFVDYIRENGPQVGETLSSIGNSLLQIVEAAAPLGGPTLRILESFADAIATIADSPLGTPLLTAVSAMSALSLATRAYQGVQRATFGSAGLASIRATSTALTTVTTAQQRATMSAQQLAAAEAKRNAVARSGLATFGKQAAVLGGLAVVGTGVADQFGLTNTASLALAGSLAGPWGAAIGGGIGLALDFASANDDVEESLRQVNQIAATGDLDQMRAEFDRLAASGQDVAAQALDVKIRFEEASQALERSNVAALFAASGIQATAAGLDTATKSADEFSASLVRARDALSQEASLDSYEAALDAVYEGLKRNGRTLDENTEKGRANRANLRELAGSMLEYAETIQDPILRSAFLDKARGEFIRARVAAGESRKAAREFANQILGLNQVVGRPRIDTSGMAAAIKQGNQLLGIFAALRSATPPNRFSSGPSSDPGDLLSFPSNADGGTVPKTGMPYADRHLYLLADGEEVISNRDGQADRNRTLLKAINAGRLAEGGTAGGMRRGGALGDYIRNDLDMKFPSTIRQWDRALAESTKVLERETGQRQKVLDQANEVRSAIRSGYQSELFGQRDAGSVWMSNADRRRAGTGDVFSTLTSDIANLNSLKAATTQLQSKGLNGAALANLLSNGSLQDVQAFAGASRADVMRYESLFNQRERALAATGNVAATAAFGAQLAAANAQLREAQVMTRALTRVERLLEKNPKATGAEIARAIRGAAPKRRAGRAG